MKMMKIKFPAETTLELPADVVVGLVSGRSCGLYSPIKDSPHKLITFTITSKPGQFFKLGQDFIVMTTIRGIPITIHSDAVLGNNQILEITKNPISFIDFKSELP